MATQPAPPSSVDPWRAGLRCRCPQCGEGRLYQGFLSLAPRCERCGLSYEFADAGDGPAVFVMLIVGFIVVGGALVLEVKQQPPFWLHAVIWLPLTVALAGLLLRPLKATLIALQHHHKARLGRLDKP